MKVKNPKNHAGYQQGQPDPTVRRNLAGGPDRLHSSVQDDMSAPDERIWNHHGY